MRLMMVGGGTGGSVTPLLAIAVEIKKTEPQTEILFIGTKKGVPERKMVDGVGLAYRGIFCGKLRRYFDLRNFLDPILLLLGIIEAIVILRKFKPQLVISAGSFVAVPVSWAAWFLHIPTLIHQQDFVPGLANILTSGFAKMITVSLDKSLNDFPKNKTFLTGNPVRSDIFSGDKNRARQNFHLDENLPSLLIVGGGTGAGALNEWVWQLIPELTKFCQIIHLAGKEKAKPEFDKLSSRYHQHQFLIKEMIDALTVADLVVSRAGMGSLTELAVLGKPSIILPIPDSHQELNAKYFLDKKAVVVLWQKHTTVDSFLQTIKELILKPEELQKLSQNIKKMSYPEATKNIVARIKEICYTD